MDTTQERNELFAVTLRQKLDRLSVYELRALYYLMRANSEFAGSDASFRVVGAIEKLTGEMTIDECVGFGAALMRQLEKRDPDLIVRQAIKEAYAVETKG